MMNNINNINNINIEALAHVKWKKAGRPEGKSLDFWLDAEKQWEDYPKDMLKLPICPSCNTTDLVYDNCYAIMDAGWHCRCGLEWNSRHISFNEWWSRSFNDAND